jgi:hypothetical protein
LVAYKAQHTLAAMRFAFIVGEVRFLKEQGKPQWAVQITIGTHLMKWKIIIRWSCLCLFILLTVCDDADVGMMVQASADAVRAVTLPDEDVRRLPHIISPYGILRARAKITSHCKRPSIPLSGVAKTRHMPDMPLFPRLAERAPEH